jgi:hypothetical protein
MQWKELMSFIVSGTVFGWAYDSGSSTLIKKQSDDGE